MKIDRVCLRHLRMELKSPFETSFGRIYFRDCILVEINSQGLNGYGECVADRDPGYSYETSDTAWHIMKDFLIPAILTSEIENPQHIATKFDFVKGHPMAKAGVEMAFWDLFGKQNNISLRSILGGQRERVKVGVSLGIQDSPLQLVNTVEAFLKLGYRRIKIKIKPGRDLVDAKMVRKTFPDLALQVDANSAYTIEDATALLPLDELHLLLIEQP